jgi:phenylalanyl-tRNA synthetase alpha chain
VPISQERIEELTGLLKSSVVEVAKAPLADKVDQFRVQWLGRKGFVTELYADLREVPPAERAAVGKLINTLKQTVEAELESLQKQSRQFTIEHSLYARAVDVTLPAPAAAPWGALHPVTLMRQILLKEFRRLGFSVWDGPEIDFDHYNFSALNFPDNHPSRDMQDTFFVDGLSHKMILRTHTSNVQIHAMLDQPPPLRIVAPGRVYRCDNDATHSPMFHQIECVAVDEGLSFANLKHLIETFLQSVFGSHSRMRLRPSFFPFVEPGAEVDMMCTMCSGKGCRVCKNTGWLEIGGCGMIHPNVFENVGYDSEVLTGYAFGFGIDRMAMLAFGIPDLRLMFEGRQAFHQQFPATPPCDSPARRSR